MKRLLLLILILLSIGVKAQTVKIGNITIDSATASKYFLDCYILPDTVYEKSQSDGLVINWNIDHTMGWSNAETREQSQERQSRIREYNQNLQRIALAKYGDGIPQRWLIPRKPSEIDFIKWTIKNKKP